MPGHPQYTRLDTAVVKETVERLHARIEARFSERSLPRIALELSGIVDAVSASRPRQPWLVWMRLACRVLIAVLAVLAPGALALAVWDGLHGGTTRGLDWITIGESVVNDLVFVGIAIAFLWALPNRVERTADLRLLHRLRSLAHVIDMHQLTKDPDRFRPEFRPTAETVDLELTPIQLSNYLDYCSELLSLVAKAAAILAENNSDHAVLNAVQAIEALTNDMSRKIWQKIALLPRPDASGEPTAVGVPHSS